MGTNKIQETLLGKAIVFATNAHANTVDKGGQPYILHPLRVMFSMDTDEERAVAVLHDVVEDTEWNIETIYNVFGKVIGDGVKGVTRIEQPEKEKYFDFVRRSMENPISHKVKIADILDNMRPERNAYLKPEENMTSRYKKALGILLTTDVAEFWCKLYNKNKGVI